MKVLDAGPQGRVLEDVSSRSELFRLAKQINAEVIAEMAEYLEPEELEQVSTAMNAQREQWQEQLTSK